MILPIKFVKREDYEREFSPKNRENMLPLGAKSSVTIQIAGVVKPKQAILATKSSKAMT